jgi:hypothetical protein
MGGGGSVKYKGLTKAFEREAKRRKELYNSTQLYNSITSQRASYAKNKDRN